MYDLTRLISFPRPLFGPCRALVRQTPQVRGTVRPRLEWLEDRITPNTYMPTTFADDGTDNSLRGVITQANNDPGTATDTIQLAAGTYKLTIDNTAGHDVLNKYGDLNITNTSHALVIQGVTDASGKPATIIDQTVADRVFQIVNPGTTVTFENVIIEGGEAQDDGTDGVAAGSTKAEGGGILDDGGDVTLSNVVLQSNQAKAGGDYDAKGGGIYVFNGGSLTIQSSVIKSNVASGGNAVSVGGAEGGYAEGGGIYIDSTGQTTIIDSTLLGNTLTGGNGGDAYGGSIVSQGGGLLTIFASILSGNTLTGEFGGSAFGGSIYAGGPTTITDSTLSGNTLTGSNGGSDYDGGGAFGGSVYASGPLTISASILSGNTLTGGDRGGDAGDVEGGSISASGPLTISASILSGNTLTGGSGGSGGRGGHADGGSIASYGGPLTISASILSGNTLTGGTGGTGGHADGGSIDADIGAVTVIDSTLSGNTLTGGNGNGALGGGAYFRASGKLVNSTIAGNQVIGGSGASNYAAYGGGLFFAVKATATLTNVTVADNKASPAPGTSGNTVGGGIDVDTSGTITLVNTLVALNSADYGPDYAGVVSSSDHNLIGNADGTYGVSADQGDLLGSTANPLNPQLGPLANNGGPTPTMALLAGSPAINAGDNALAVDADGNTLLTDQRGAGFPRVVSDIIDIGAFEYQPPLPTIIANPSSQTVTAGQSVSFTASASGNPTPTVQWQVSTDGGATFSNISGAASTTLTLSNVTTAMSGYEYHAVFTNSAGSISSSASTLTVNTPPSQSPSPAPPPTLQTLPLLAFIDALLGAVETVNGNGTETVVDSFFGIPLFVSTYDSAGNLMSVTLFGIDITLLIELL